MADSFEAGLVGVERIFTAHKKAHKMWASSGFIFICFGRLPIFDRLNQAIVIIIMPS